MASEKFDELILCLSSIFDLDSQQFLGQVHLLKDQINTSNVKFISGALLTIARRLPDRQFFAIFHPFVQNENFAKLGITVNKKAVVRLID